MKTMSVQEFQEHLQETIASLVSEGEILITSDNERVARLIGEKPSARNAAVVAEADESAQEVQLRKLAGEKLSKWREETFGERKFDTLTSLMADRDERFER